MPNIIFESDIPIDKMLQKLSRPLVAECLEKDSEKKILIWANEQEKEKDKSGLWHSKHQSFTISQTNDRKFQISLKENTEKAFQEALGLLIPSKLHAKRIDSSNLTAQEEIHFNNAADALRNTSTDYEFLGKTISIATPKLTFDHLFQKVKATHKDNCEKDDDTKSIKIWFPPQQQGMMPPSPVNKAITPADLELTYKNENESTIELRTVNDQSVEKAIRLAVETLEATHLDISTISANKQKMFITVLEKLQKDAQTAGSDAFDHVKLIGSGNKQLYPPISGAPDPTKTNPVP